MIMIFIGFITSSVEEVTIFVRATLLSFLVLGLWSVYSLDTAHAAFRDDMGFTAPLFLSVWGGFVLFQLILFAVRRWQTPVDRTYVIVTLCMAVLLLLAGTLLWGLSGLLVPVFNWWWERKFTQTHAFVLNIGAIYIFYTLHQRLWMRGTKPLFRLKTWTMVKYALISIAVLAMLVLWDSVLDRHWKAYRIDNLASLGYIALLFPLFTGVFRIYEQATLITVAVGTFLGAAMIYWIFQFVGISFEWTFHATHLYPLVMGILLGLRGTTLPISPLDENPSGIWTFVKRLKRRLIRNIRFL